MKSVNKRIAQFKLADVFFQILTFILAVYLVKYAQAHYWKDIRILYFFAGCQVLSCACWLIAEFIIPELPALGWFKITFFIIGAIVALAMLDDELLLVISIRMLFIGPVLGIAYFLRTCKDYLHYRKLEQLEQALHPNAGS